MEKVKPKFLWMVLGIFIAYSLGVVTARYKLFPYKSLREFKRFVQNDGSVNAHERNNKYSYTSTYYLNKTSFFVEHNKHVDIVMLGDSLTDNAEWGILLPQVNIADHGISGDTTLGVLNRLDLAINTNASKVFVMIGVNDLYKGIGIEEVVTNYRKIVNELVENKVDVYIQSTLFLAEGNARLNKKIVQLNEELEQFARANESVAFVDLNSKLSNGKFLIAEYTNDIKMLNGKGYKIWRDMIKPYVH